MTEVSDATSPEASNPDDVILSVIASQNNDQKREEAITALFLTHLNTIEKQMEEEEAVQKEIAQLDNPQAQLMSNNILNFI